MENQDDINKLRGALKLHGISRTNIADLVGVSLSTVDAWFAPIRSKRWRRMRPIYIQTLHLMLDEQMTETETKTIIEQIK